MVASFMEMVIKSSKGHNAGCIASIRVLADLRGQAPLSQETHRNSSILRDGFLRFLHLPVWSDIGCRSVNRQKPARPKSHPLKELRVFPPPLRPSALKLTAATLFNFPPYERRRQSARELSGNSPQPIDSAGRLFECNLARGPKRVHTIVNAARKSACATACAKLPRFPAL